MAAFETTHLTVDGLSFGGRLSETITKFFGTFAAWNDARMTRNALAKLSDRELDDIGLSRSDIEAIH